MARQFVMPRPRAVPLRSTARSLAGRRPLGDFERKLEMSEPKRDFEAELQESIEALQAFNRGENNLRTRTIDLSISRDVAYSSKQEAKRVPGS